MFTYQFGPLRIKVTFDDQLIKIADEVKNYYVHAILQDNEKFNHHCHIRDWQLDGYQSPNEDNIIWQDEKRVKVESKRNIGVNSIWDEDLNTVVEIFEGTHHLFETDRKRYWEFSQRISAYPTLVKNNGLMIHCAAIIVDGKVHIFLGPSGAGKSTTAEKAIECGYQVLTDDTAILKMDNGILKAYSSPYVSKSGLIGLPGEYEVGNFYLLKQSYQEKISIANKSQFVRSLQERIYETQYLSHIFPYKSKGLSGIVGGELLKHAFNISKNFNAFNYEFTLESDLRELLECNTIIKN